METGEVSDVPEVAGRTKVSPEEGQFLGPKASSKEA